MRSQNNRDPALQRAKHIDAERRDTLHQYSSDCTEMTKVIEYLNTMLLIYHTQLTLYKHTQGVLHLATETCWLTWLGT